MEKLRVKELRLGNYFLYHMVDEDDDRKEWDEVAQIDAGDITYLAGLDKDSEADRDFKPIGLTEGWLLKLGFEEADSYEYFKGKFGVFYNYKTKEIKYFIAFGCVVLSHVHQLQNLYYALMGEELRLKDKPCK